MRRLAPGFDVGVAASGVPDAGKLAQSPAGELVLSQHMEGSVVKLRDGDGDGTLYLTDDNGGVVYWIRPSPPGRRP